MGKRIIFIGIFLLGVSHILFGQITWQDISPVTTGSYNAIAVADFNNDGLEDIAAAPSSGGIQIWYKTSSGWNLSTDLVPTSSIFYSLAAGDINFDGYVDIVGSGDNMVEAYLHKFNNETSTFYWLTANDFSPPPSGVFKHITLANVNKIEEKYGCVTYTSNPCQTTIPKGLDIIMTDNSGSGNGIKIYLWAGMKYIIGEACFGSWTEESIPNLPHTGYYNQVIGTDIDLDQDDDIIAVKDGGIDALFRVYVVQPGGCYMPDQHNQYFPEWRIENGQGAGSDILPSHGNYRSMTITDINGDGYPDIIATGNPVEDMVNTGIEVWYSINPNPAWFTLDWQWKKEIDVTNPFRYLLIPGTFNYIGQGDFNGDYVADIAVTATSPPTQIWKGHIFVNNNIDFKPEKFWWETESVPTSSGSFPMLSVGDFHGNGRQGIAYPDNNNGGIKVYVRTSADINSSTGWYPHNIYTMTGLKPGILPGVKFGGTNICTNPDSEGNSPAIANLADPVAAYVTLALDSGSVDGAIKLFKTRGEKDWTEIPAPSATGKYLDARIAFINNDTYPDVVASKSAISGQYDGIKVWFYQPLIWLDRSTGLSCDGRYDEIALADFNNDRYTDIAAAKTDPDGTSGGIEIWTGQPDDTFGWIWSLFATLQTSNEKFVSLTTNDFNGDGIPDVIACGLAMQGPRIVAFYHHADGSWTSEIIDSPTTPCYRIISAYVDTDDLPDIVVTTQGSGILIYRHIINAGGNYQWISLTSPASIGSYSGIAAADINKDGCTDFVAQSDSSPQATRTWYMSKWTQGCVPEEWTEQTQIDSGYTCSDMASGDLSLDYLPDIVSTCEDATGTNVLRANYNYTIEGLPTLMNPPNDTTITNTRQPMFQLFDTSPYSNCLRYQIEIDNTSPYDFNPPDDIFMGFVTPKGWSSICNVSGNGATFNIPVDNHFPSGLPDGIYHWRGRAYDNFQLSDPSGDWTFIIDAADKTPPASTFPIYLSKITNGVHLSWNKNTESDVKRYRIFRATSASFNPLPSNMINEYLCLSACPTIINYNDTAFTMPNVIYYYKVKAVDTTGNQGP